LTARPFAIASRLALVTALATFGLIVLGSLVRTTGSGLACPDWPLCHGRLIPPFQFNVLIEWFHRLAALIVSLLLLATVAWIAAHSVLRARLGALALLAVGLLLIQVLLGALTVWKLLDPAVVGGHLAVALLFFSTLLVLVLVAGTEAAGSAAPPPLRPAGLLPTCATATALTFLQCLLGGAVSANAAALACPDWPTCHGEWFPPLAGLVGLQMMHRYGAYAVVAALLFLSWRTRALPDPRFRAGGQVAMLLTVAQVVLGVCNVFLGTPPWLSAAHLATAVTLLATLVSLTFRAASLRGASPARWPRPVEAS
jgi:heme A synthase